ncbi:MAG: hypothetical protein JXQ65_10605 [Candidatus Marinimicrobia bacterium]|nr:hypothetical protein [Candidatus Neomarinimicrobiota bacterium]
MKNYIKIFVLVLVFALSLNANWNVPQDLPGSQDNIKHGYLDGNKILSNFTNNTIIHDSWNLGGSERAQWPAPEFAKIMGAQTKVVIGYKLYFDSNGNIIEDKNNLDQAVDTLYFLENGFDTMDQGLLPASGYDAGGLSPAISDDPNTWPDQWKTDRAVPAGQKLWYGKRGMGYYNADLESYFVTNNFSSIDNSKAIKERGGIELRCAQRSYQWKTYPMDDVIIWEYEISNESGFNSVETYFGFVRENTIGGDEYINGEVVYLDSSNYKSTSKLDMAFTWDVNFMPVERPQYPGLIGFSVLETPGNENDGIDNDGDGLVDESRYNHDETPIAVSLGIDNLVKFKKYFGIGIAEYKKMGTRIYIVSDEDKDWADGEDINGDGLYQFGIDYPNDDIGSDGLGPYDVNYPGPDADGTECNHKPDFGEPNYGPLDYGESDQVALNIFKTYNQKFTQSLDLANDEAVLKEMETRTLWGEQNTPSNYLQLFATQAFPFNAGGAERISFAELHSYAYLDGLKPVDISGQNPEERLKGLYNKKSVIERVAVRDYNFAKPPITPTISAYSKDGEVFVSWNDIAQKFTYDPFIGHNDANNGNDFEGYKIYKSTDADMNDAKIVTNAYGEVIKFRPIQQYDAADGRHGYVDYGVKSGNGFYLGSDGGLNNYFIDSDVINGKTYYYAISAFDYGIEEYIAGKDGSAYGNSGVGNGIAPIENTFSYSDGTRNIASVVPSKKAIGYIAPNIELTNNNITFGTGWVAPEIKLTSKLKQGHKYKVKFEVEKFVEPISAVDSKAHCYRADKIKVYDVTDGVDTLIYYEDEGQGNFTADNFVKRTDDYWPETPSEHIAFAMQYNKVLESSEFDGLILKWFTPVEMPQVNSHGWVEGFGDIDFSVYRQIDATGRTDYDQNGKPLLPFNFDIIFTENQNINKSLSKDNLFLLGVKAIEVKDHDRENIKDFIYDQPLNFYALMPEITDSLGRPDTLDLFIKDENKNGTYEPHIDPIYATVLYNYYYAGKTFVLAYPIVSPIKITFPGGVAPTSGTYGVRWDRSFWETDSIEFQVSDEVFFDEDKAKEEFKNIKVVPNPYVVTNILEPNAEKGQRERVMMFTGLPPKCKIDIYSLTGIKIKTIDFDNSVGNVENGGVATWNLETENGHDIAAGYYIYKITSEMMSREKVGKFAVIK